ncbi:hypothetical protein DFH08DRAFT_892140 [Mycena albidolilacea]|uniref:Uncharacterized protein n=1 Tax=Mycena albidolilacea TaxID=1033008 RepID=A0AAD6ZDZ6_9AGAR|nr:hypothetical protein DFH08DRAFT_892140 [Mycena albidolilacea]
MNSGLRTRASQLSGLLTLSCNVGVSCMSLKNVSVTASLAADLKRGLDCFHFVRDSAPDLVVYFSRGVPLDFRTVGSGFLPSSSTGSTPVFRGNVGAQVSSSVSMGGPGAVPTPSLMPST